MNAARRSHDTRPVSLVASSPHSNAESRLSVLVDVVGQSVGERRESGPVTECWSVTSGAHLTRSCLRDATRCHDLGKFHEGEAGQDVASKALRVSDLVGMVGFPAVEFGAGRGDGLTSATSGVASVARGLVLALLAVDVPGARERPAAA
jgi:xanthosine utilization system XapX-like protein